MKQYLDLLRLTCFSGEPHQDRTGVGTRSIFGAQFRHDMRTGFPLLTTKKMPLRVIAEELFWFISGSTNNDDLNARRVTIWDEWADEMGQLGPVYGYQWRYWGGGKVDQLDSLLDGLFRNPASRRHLVTAWNPEDVPLCALPPCHYSFQVKCHGDDGISLMFNMRSADVFLGVPFNIASYALLLVILGAITGREPRYLYASFGDLHLYNNHIEQAKRQLQRKPLPLPRVEVEIRHLKAPAIDQLENVCWDDVKLTDYMCHPAIRAEVAV